VNKTVGLCAKRNSGKSVLLKYIVNNFKHEFQTMFVVCPTESINKFYSDMVEKKYIFDELFHWLEKSIYKITQINADVKGKTKKKLNNILLILDDM
jgi:AAA+ ATPase superfamily predicted ATPase